MRGPFFRWYLSLPCRLLLVLWLTSLAVHAADPPVPKQFLVVSDFHFDPFDGLTKDQFAALAAAPLDEWPRILAVQPPAAYGRDAPAALVQSVLTHARELLPDPAFILFPGDFLAHGWQSKYDRLAAKTRDEDPAAYRTFSTRTMQFLAQLVRQAFPHTPFLPVLGNDDSFCGDYMIGPASPFLQMCSDVWLPLLHFPDGSRDRAPFVESCARGGYYSIRLPQFSNHRLLALNTIFFSTLYDNACGVRTATPALDEFLWLEQALTAAREARESVWLLMHIPPGIDSYSTNRNQGNPQPFWQPELLARFLQLLDRHRDLVQIAIAGHTHMDDFRVARIEGEARLLTKIVPAVSPIFGNNPGFQIFESAGDRGAITDYATYALPLHEAGSVASPGWQLEYAFRSTFKLPQLNTAAIVDLSNQLRNEGPARTAYIRNYSVGAAPPAIPPQLLNCAIGNVTSEEFLQCLRKRE
jgi:hypothetical protein